MRYVIDAWLERREPYLRVIHRQTGVRVIDWHGDQVRGLLDRGDIYAVDLQKVPAGDKELVQDLFLLACLERDVLYNEEARLTSAAVAAKY